METDLSSFIYAGSFSAFLTRNGPNKSAATQMAGAVFL